MGYTPCPKCGSRKLHTAPLCRACKSAETELRNQERFGNPNPSGLCQCGCGEPAPISKYTAPKHHLVKGFPARYIVGHALRKSPDLYIVDPETQCWIWQRGLTGEGYGKFMEGGKTISAHRFFYEQAKGPIPKGMVPDHLCRNRACINPDHIELVTHVENCRRGASTKLSQADIDRMRQLGGTMKQREIAELLGTTQGYVSRVLNGTKRR